MKRRLGRLASALFAAPDPAGAGGRLATAFATEELAGLRLAFLCRLGALLVVAVWLALQNPWPQTFWYLGIVALSVLLGAAPLLLARAGASPATYRYLLPVLDFALFTFAVMAPTPWDDPALPLAMRLRFDNVLFGYILLAAQVLTLSPRAVLWSGIAAAACWGLGALWVAARTGFTPYPPPSEIFALPAAERVALFNDPTRVNGYLLAQEMLLFVVVGAVLAAAVARARRLVGRQAEAERARANLARHFSPNMVEELAAADEPLGAVKRLDAAVLFADLVGFTRLAEELTPEQTVALLRDLHGRLAGAVFAHGGTLDKYLGDGIMATFGTPRTSGRDAANALAAARAMLRAVDDLNRQRRLLRQPPLRLAVGIHAGPLVLGDIGDAQRLEYAVLGETVNIAQRLEQLTRALDARLCVSDDFMVALKAESAAAATGDLVRLSPQPIRGLRRRLGVWMLPLAALAPDAAAMPPPDEGGDEHPRPTLH
jgi:adenylate cyclase